MKFEKSIATFLAALMSLIAVAYPVIAATNLGQYPSFLLNSDGSLGTLIVVGSSASTQDVIGATDLATRLAQAAAVSTNMPGTSASINGLEKNTIDINYGNLTDVFPNPIRNFHYNGLQTGTLSYKGNTYNYHEDVNLGTLYFSHDSATNYINGTETMVVQSGQLIYDYVFDTALNCASLATTAGTTCFSNSSSSYEYTNPVKIYLLGKPFVIVGIGSSQVVMLSGNVGTATATSGVTTPSGNYTVYSDLGNNGATGWARIIVKDASGNTVDNPRVINTGDSYDFTAEGFTVKVTNVRALQDGTIVGADVVLGPIGQTTVTYTTSCSIGGTGSSNFNFPGETNWCIQVKSGSFATQGQIAAGDTLQVVYKPSSTQYFKYTGATVKLPLPNNYGEVGLEGWNYNSFATLTFKYLSPTTVYYSIGAGSTNSTPVAATTVSGIEIDSDVAGTLVDPYTSTGYSRVYYLFNTSTATPALNLSTFPVMWGFWDSVNNRIGVNITTASATAGGWYYKVLNQSMVDADHPDGAHNFFVFNTTLSYGGGAAAADQSILFVNISSPLSAGTQATNSPTAAVSYFSAFAVMPSTTSAYMGRACVATASSVLAKECGVLLNWVNTSTTWSTATSPTFRLYTSDSTDTRDVQSVQTPSSGGSAVYQDIGQAVQDVVSNGGVIVSAPASAGSNVAIVKLPAQTLYVKAYVGKIGAAGTTSGSYQQIVPVTSSVARLDSEITSSDEASKDLILVGGPCVNTLVASLATASGSASAMYPYTCASWPGRNFGSIRVIDDAFATGHQVVVVAGTRAAETRLAANVLQQYDTLLAGQTSQNVEVTSLSASGITAVS